jgi:hypothetical protein
VARPRLRPPAAHQHGLHHGQHQPAADALEHPRGDQAVGALSKAGAERSEQEDRERGQPHPLAAEPVDQPAGDRHGDAEREQIAGGHPLDGLDRRVQVGGQRPECDADDRRVEDDRKDAGHHHESEPEEGRVQPVVGRAVGHSCSHGWKPLRVKICHHILIRSAGTRQ